MAPVSDHILISTISPLFPLLRSTKLLLRQLFFLKGVVNKYFIKCLEKGDTVFTSKVRMSKLRSTVCRQQRQSRNTMAIPKYGKKKHIWNQKTTLVENHHSEQCWSTSLLGEAQAVELTKPREGKAFEGVSFVVPQAPARISMRRWNLSLV